MEKVGRLIGQKAEVPDEHNHAESNHTNQKPFPLAVIQDYHVQSAMKMDLYYSSTLSKTENNLKLGAFRSYLTFELKVQAESERRVCYSTLSDFYRMWINFAYGMTRPGTARPEYTTIQK